VRQAIGWSGGLVLAAAFALGAQGRGSTIVSIPNPLFAYSSDANVWCGPAPLEQWQRDQGIARLFQFQLPLHSRTGVFGVDGFGQPRYLSVVMEQPGNPTCAITPRCSSGVTGPWKSAGNRARRCAGTPRACRRWRD
jgi:hypothetical protein